MIISKRKINPLEILIKKDKIDKIKIIKKNSELYLSFELKLYSKYKTKIKIIKI